MVGTKLSIIIDVMINIISKLNLLYRIRILPWLMRKVSYFKQTTVPLRDLVQINSNCFSGTSAVISSSTTNRFNYKASNHQKDIYDQFVYQDTITNKKIKVRQAKSSYGVSRLGKNNSTYQHIQLQNGQRKKRQSRFKRHDSTVINVQKQMSDLNQCFLMLKSTQMFKLNSLRQKLFGNQQKTTKSNLKQTFKMNKVSDNQNKQNDLRRLILRKKKIRDIVQSTVNQASLNQFRKHYQDADHKPNQKILNMVKSLPKSINRHNIQKIMHTLQPVEEFVPEIINKEQSTKQFCFQGQSKLKEQAIDYMRKQIKMNGQFLIKPSKDRLLYQKIFHNKRADKEISNLLNETTVKHQQKQQLSLKYISQDQIEIPSKINIETFKDITNQHDMDLHLQQIQNLELNKFNNSKKTNFKKHKKLSSQITSVFTPFMSQFNFKNSSNKKSLTNVKATFLKNKGLSQKKLSLKQQKFLFLLQNGILFDVQKQILMNQNNLYFQDKNQNNILHISSKNRYFQIFAFTIQQLKKIDMKKRKEEQKSEVEKAITAKNRNHKTPLDLAILYGAKQIIQIIQQIKLQYNILY